MRKVTRGRFTIRTKEDAYLAVYVLASNRYDIQTWRMNAYVTIHADTGDELDDDDDEDP